MMVLRFLFFCALIWLSQCSSNSQNNSTDLNSETPIWTPEPSDEWPVSTPESNGIDEGVMDLAYVRASNSTHLRSLLVLRNGNLIGESYFQGYRESSMHSVRSVTKTVMAMLIGIAIEKGYLQGIDETIEPYFVEQYPDLAPEKWDITIRNLLTMTSGFQWDESNEIDYNIWVSSTDPIGFVLNRPLIAEPGTVFTYNSGTVHLLSAIITKATAKTTLDFAKEVLFEPLGFGSIYWEVLAGGYHNGGAGLDLRARDMAKLGQLFLNDGVWGEQELMTSSWINRMLQPVGQSTGVYGPLSQIDYGYLLWLGVARTTPILLSWGWAGQFIATFPQKNLIMITTSKWDISVNEANAQELENLDLMVNYVLPAVQ